MEKEKNLIIAKHYQMQYGCFFSNIQVRNGVLFAYNDVMHCAIWNHCCFIPDTSLFDLDYLTGEADKFLTTRNRLSCIYIDDDKRSDFNETILGEKGYKCFDNEAWLKFDNTKSNLILDIIPTLDMKKVDNERDLSDFVNVCSSCFDEEYGQAIKREFYRYQPHKSFYHCAFYHEGTCVASASVYYIGSVFFIHNVGVIKEYRQCGKAREVMKRTLSTIYEICASPIVVLQCDGGGFIEDFYKKIGFALIHRRWGYIND